MADLTGVIAQPEPGLFERAKNSAQETVDSVKNTAGEWSDTATAVVTGNSGIVDALKNDTHDEAAVRNISNMGSMATTGIAVASIVKGGMAAYASCTPAAALGTFGGVLAAGAVGAFAGAGLVKYLKLDEAWLDILGKPKLAKPGRQPATAGHEIAHSHPIAGALCGLLAGIAIGVAVGLAVAATGGLGAPLIVGALCGGFAGSFVGSLISGMCSKAATRSGQIDDDCSPDVYFENAKVARVGDPVSCDKHSPTKQIAEGSTTIFVNNKALARIGHKTTCSATIQQGCKAIFADDTTAQYLKIDPELSAREQLFVSGAEVVITLGAGYLVSKIGEHCGEPINPADGSFFTCRTDFEYPSILPLKLTRTYAGKDPVESILGGRWICNWSQRLVYLTDEPTANLEDGEGEVLQFPLGKAPEFNSRNLKATHYQLKGTRQQARLFDSRSQQTLIFETTETNPHIGRLTSIRDRNNNRIDFIYKGNNLTRVAHSDGTTFHVTTNSQGFIETIASEESGRLQPVVQYSYTATGELTDVQSLFAGEFHYTYTQEGWLNHWRDSGATSVEITYDTEGRVIATKTPDGMFNDRFVYYPEERKTEYYDATGGCFTFWFNDNNQVIREQDPLGNITTHEVSGLNRKLSTTDALGRKTAFEYDIFGHLTGQIDWTGRSTSLAYNKEGQLIQIDYPDGTKASWVYDDNGNLTSATAPDGLITYFAYDDQGKFLYEIGPDGATTRLEYNYHGRLAALHNALGQTTGFDLDRWGRLLETTDPTGNRTGFEYDQTPDNPRAGVSRIIHPDKGEERFAYDNEGLPKTHIAQEGQTTHYTHGSFDLLRGVIDPKGYTTKLEYDGAARLQQIINAQGQKWTYSYDLAGRLIHETDWAGRQTTYIRDAIGRVLTKRHPDGIEQHLTWDELDRIAAVDTEKQRITYEYDNSDRLIRAAIWSRTNTEPESDLQFCYDDKGRLEKEIQNCITIEYKYDQTGRCISRTSPTGETRFEFDLLGQFTGMNSNGHTLDFTRDSRGLETLRQYQGPGTGDSELGKAQLDAFSLKQSYDPCGRLTSQIAGQKTAQPTLAHERLAEINRKYNWDKSGRLIGVKDNKRGTSSYQYDARDQINRINRIIGLDKQTEEQFGYDSLMNLAFSKGELHKYENGTVRTIGNSSYRYDLRGRVKEKRVVKNGFRPKTWHYSWDNFDRLIETHTPDGAIWRYSYDAFGRRIKKECTKAGEFTKQQATAFIWLGATLAEEYSTTGDKSEATRWHFEPGTFNPLAKEVNGNFYPIVTDHLGTPKELFDTDGNCVWQADHGLWGETEVSYSKKADNYQSLVDCSLRFQNQWEDKETGLYYNLNRYYDPDSGQYLSSDPIRLNGGLRTHGYVHNPMQWVDPWGLILTGSDASGRPLSSSNYSVWGQVTLPPEQYGASRGSHFQYANEQLYNQIKQSPSLGKVLPQDVVTHVQPGLRGAFDRESPPGMTWHHNAQDPTKIELVPRAQHKAPGPVQESLHPDNAGGFKALQNKC
jgi:RHS repeat-associated protein